MAPIIEVRNISKQYHLGEKSGMYGNLREALVHILRKPWAGKPAAAGPTEDQNSFWALRGINLDIEKGDTIGIIGSNGAGKSTLLKILSRIVVSSEGYVKVRG